MIELFLAELVSPQDRMSFHYREIDPGSLSSCLPYLPSFGGARSARFVRHQACVK